jgi:NAD+ kinase
VLEGEISDGAAMHNVRALNDIIVSKGATGRATRLAVSVSGEPLVSWAADGIIVATATGSTAYSFSAGGPIVSPNVDCLIVTPVSPHGLFDRSVIVGSREEIRLDVEADPEGALLSADGHHAIRLTGGANVRVRAADDRIRLAKVEPRPFWRLVREKFRLAPET